MKPSQKIPCAEEFLLCRVGAGRSYLVDKAAQAETQLHQGTALRCHVWSEETTFAAVEID